MMTMLTTIDDARTRARDVLLRLHHYILPNQSGDPLLSTPYYEADVNMLALVLVETYAGGIRDAAGTLVEIREGLNK